MKTRTKSIKQNLTIQQASKQRKKSQSKNENKSKPTPANISFIKPPKSCNKQNQQAKKYLQKTINILSHCFNIKNIQTHQSSNNILNLSSSLYKIVKQNIHTDKKISHDDKQNYNTNVIITKTVNKQSHSKIKDQIFKNNHQLHKNNRDSRKVIISQKQNILPRSSSAMANYSILQASSICQQNSIIGYQNNVPQPSQNSIFVKRRSNSTLDSYFRQKFGTNAQDEQAVQKKLRVIKALKKSQQIVSKSNRSNIQSSMMLTSLDVNQKGIVIQKLKSKNLQKVR